MRNFFLISGLLLAAELCIGQETRKLQTYTIDDHQEGYALISYKIPADGVYTFSLDGGFTPKKSSTIYYCEYQLQLRSKDKNYSQNEINIASQAQDGNVCYFGTNQKNNTVSGVFNKDEEVELRLRMFKSDVNGAPHHQLNLTDNTLVTVQQAKDVLTRK